MKNLTLVPMLYGWLCEVRHPSGFLIASGFCNHKAGESAKAIAVRRALAQLS